MPAGGNTADIDWSAIPDESEKSIAALVDESLAGRLPASKKELAMAHLRHETGREGLDSNVAKHNNNVSGITWNDNFPEDWKGTARPSAEGGNYVHFPAINDWADKYMEIMSRDKGHGAPIDAADVSDFAKRLKKNGYYTAPESTYAAGMQAMMDKYGSKGDDIDWSAIPEESTVEKKSPDVSAVGSAISSPTEPGGFSGNPWENPQATVDMGPAQGISVGVNGQNAPQAADNPAPVLSTQAVTNNIFGTNVDGSPVVQDTTPAEPTPSERTKQSVDVLANDYMESQHTHAPEMQEAFKGTALDHGDNPLNQITNPAGDPAYTTHYLASRKEQIEKERQQAIASAGYNDPFKSAGLNPNGIKDINEAYDRKINRLQDATSHILSLQLFNKEYADKPLTSAESATQLDALKNKRDSELSDFTQKLKTEQSLEKELLARSFTSKKDSDPELLKKTKEHSEAITQLKDKIAHINRDYQAATGKVKSQSKWDGVRLGIEQKRLMGDKTAAQDAANYDAGRPISPERRYQYQLAGNEIKKTGMAAAQESGQTPVVEDATPHIESQKQIENDNIDFLKSKWANEIANRKYAAEGKLASAIGMVLPTDASISDEDIQKYGKEAGLTSSQINKVEAADVPTPATIWQQFIKGAANTTAPLYERGIRSAVALTGGDNEAVNEHFQPGWENRSGLGAAVVGNMPSDQNTFHNLRGAIGQIMEGAGGLSTFMPEVEAVSGAIKGAGIVNDAAKAEKLANFGTMAFNGYNSAYHDANEVIGDKPEDEWKRQTYALTNGLLEGAIFSISPKAQLAKNALGMEEKTGAQLLDEIKKADGISFLQTPTFKEGIAKKIVEIAKENGTQVSLSVANELSKHIVNTITNPERRQDISEDIKNTAISTSLAMAIPSIMGGIGHVNNQTHLNEGAMFELGTNPEKYTSFVQQQLVEGKVTPKQAQTMVDGIGTMQSVISQTPTTNIEGTPMTPDQIKAYSFSLFQEHLLEQKVESLTKGAQLAQIPVDKAQMAPLNKRISELQKQREDILKVAGTSRLPAPAGTPAAPEEHHGGNDERSVATDAKSEEEAPAAKKEEEKVAETKKEDISLSSQEDQNTDVTSKNKKDEISNGQSREGKGNDGRQERTEISEATGRGQDAEVRSSAGGELSRVEEDRQLSEPVKENEPTKAASETEQPLVVKPKKKRNVPILKNEPAAEETTPAVEDKPEEQPQETTQVEPVKPTEDASTQSEEQQPEGNEQGGEPEQARAEQAGSEAATTEAESGDSHIGGKEEEIVSPAREEQTKNTDQGENDERSVVPEAPSEEEAHAAREKETESRLTEIEAGLRQQKASQIHEGNLRARAEKEGDIAAANKHNDNWYKKQSKIDKLNEEKERLHSERRDNSIKVSYNRFADKIEQSYARNKERHKGEVYASLIPGLSTKIIDPVVDFIVSRTVSSVRAAGNLHVALRATIREAKAKFPDEAHHITDKDEQAIYDHLEHLKETPRHEPVLPVDHEEYAKDLLADIKSGELSYNEAVQEVKDEVWKNRNGDPVSENVADKNKAKILNYIDWHTLDKNINDIREHREAQQAPNKIKASKLSESGLFSRYLGAETERDIFGEEGHLDNLSENKTLQRLSDIMQDTQRFTNLYNDGMRPISEWGHEMLNDIKGIGDEPKKQVAGLTGLNIELQSERIKSEKELQELNKKISITSDELARHDLQKQRGELLKERGKVLQMIGEVQNYKKKVLSAASDVLNAGRVNRLMRNEVLFEHYEKSILSEKEREAKAELEHALQQSVMEDYRNHPDYKKERSLEAEKKKSEERKATEEKKAADPNEQKKKNVIRRFKDKVKKPAYEKGRKEAEKDFGLNDKGENRTVKEFLEHLKKLKNPC